MADAHASLVSDKKTTYREFLGEKFFEHLANLEEAGADRVVFWFDN